jgi:Flp pilus assembly protein TadD
MNSLKINEKEVKKTLALKKQFINIHKLFENKNYMEAEKQALLTDAAFPKNEYIYRILIDIYEKQNKKSNAIDMYLQLLKLLPNDFLIYTNLGILYLEMAQLAKAEKSFRKAIEINSYDFYVQYNLGITLIDLNKFQEAELRLKTAKALDSNHTEVHYKLGLVLYKLEKVKEAELSFKEALTINQKNIFALNSLGVLMRDQKEFQSSEKYFKKAIVYKPDYFDAYFNLAILYNKKKEFKKSEISYIKSITLKPNNYNALNNLANVYRQQGNFKKAITYIKRAITIKPGDIIFWNNLYFPLKLIKAQEKYKKNSLLDTIKKELNFTNNVYASLLQYKLYMGSNKSEFFFKKAVSAVKRSNVQIRNPYYLENSFKNIKINEKKIIALLHFGRSGTGLLHSLIDNHSEISTLPSIYLSQFFDNIVWKKIIDNGWHKVIDNFIKIYPVLFDARSPLPIASKSGFIKNLGIEEGMTTLGKNKDEFLNVDKIIFKKELSCLISQYEFLDQITFFKLIHVAYEKSINNHQNKNLLFYHIHNPNDYSQINFISSETNACWLMMIRDPIQSCESWINNIYIKNNYNDIAKRIVTMLFDIDNPIFSNTNAVGLRLEDLKSNPSKTISVLCNWMKIKEEKTLYEMTAQGKKWWGDMSTKNISPFGEISKSKVGKVFSENDRLILSTLFYPFSVRFGYKKENLFQFKNNLLKIKPMLDQLFDFEKNIINKTKVNSEQFKNSEMYLYLRTKLIERWRVLENFHTYPNMLKPLRI